MDAELKRALMPKITPQAALRMYLQNVTSIATTNLTLGMVWTATFMEVWQSVMYPDGGRD